MPLEVNLVNLLDVLPKVSDVVNLGLHLGVPKHRLDEIRQDFCTTKELKREMLQWWLDHTLNPTWERVSSALRIMDKPVLADAVREVSQRESLHEPCEEDSLRWEVILNSLDQKLQKLQQRSEELEMKWEKGEKEWREYLKEWKRIEEGWEDFCQIQMEPSNIFTLGHRHSDLLHRYPLLERKLQKHIIRSKELRYFNETVTEHRHELRKATTELKKHWLSMKKSYKNV